MSRFSAEQWALILGGSSGFGLATAKRLAADGMSIALVHRDRRGATASAEAQFEEIRRGGSTLLSFNLDALSSTGRCEVLSALSAHLLERGKVRLLLHSIAFGNLKLLAPLPASRARRPAQARAALAAALEISEDKLEAVLARLNAGAEGDALQGLLPADYDPALLLGEEDFAQTVYAMGTSMVAWTRDVFERGLFAQSARVIGLTSEGNQLAWRGYAAVSAAKAALEAVVRSIAVEYGPYGLRANVLQPGVTQTPALAKIPGQRHMTAAARLRNPCGRLTTPEDVANVVRLLCTDDAAWINGALIRVDGGECISA